MKLGSIPPLFASACRKDFDGTFSFFNPWESPKATETPTRLPDMSYFS